VGKQRVQKLMQLHGIRAKGKRRFKFTTDSNHDLVATPNLLNREFMVSEPDKVWAGDISYSSTCQCRTTPATRAAWSKHGQIACNRSSSNANWHK
jgi:transposase InsO family protein